MRRALICGALLIVFPGSVWAHVGVRPRESKAGAEERYTVRVPTEGAVTTTSVVLEIPDGVYVLEVMQTDGATFETRKTGDRIVAITWKKEIKPKEVGEFTFRARNPDSGTEILWKAHQHFADGSVTAWAEPAGGKRPGPVTKLTASGPVAARFLVSHPAENAPEHHRFSDSPRTPQVHGFLLRSGIQSSSDGTNSDVVARRPSGSGGVSAGRVFDTDCSAVTMERCVYPVGSWPTRA